MAATFKMRFYHSIFLFLLLGWRVEMNRGRRIQGKSSRIGGAGFGGRQWYEAVDSSIGSRHWLAMA